MVMMTSDSTHGGPDHGPAIDWDFSTNANPLPPPACLQAHLAQADRRQYPDPDYKALRAHLAGTLPGGADSDGAAMRRIVPTAGSSEGIRRLTLAAIRHGVQQVWVPRHAYADYAQAAQALGLRVQVMQEPLAWLMAYLARPCAQPQLVWLCEPCNPTGSSLPQACWEALSQALSLPVHAGGALIVALDRAYEPLRLDGDDPVPADVAGRCWQLWSPNKALGLTGVRAGWITAPQVVLRPSMTDVLVMAGDVAGTSGQQAAHGLHHRLLVSMLALAPSWVLSAEGVTLLMHWHDPATQQWLREALPVLRDGREALVRSLCERGWLPKHSVTSFVLAEAPLAWQPYLICLGERLREQGIKWREADSFGLPGHVRLRAHDRQAQAVFFAALDEAAQALGLPTRPMMPAMPDQPKLQSNPQPMSAA